jgi:hypothetical protein
LTVARILGAFNACCIELTGAVSAPIGLPIAGLVYLDRRAHPIF